jgi:NADH:ubiquinone oxidoreductase subunit E
MALFMTAEKVQVCSFKDCKRAGGGPRLEKLINEVLEEKGLTDAVAVECVDCQGECGYGPNVVVDGKLVNSVRGREAVIQALGIPQEE